MSTTTSPDQASSSTAEQNDDRVFAKQLIDGLPRSATLADIHYHLGVAALVRERSLQADEAFAMGTAEAIKAGKLLTSEQVRREIESWPK